MKIGCLIEIKLQEFCVGMMLDVVCEVVNYGYLVVIQKGVGVGVGFMDVDYVVVGVILFDIVEEIFVIVDMIVKVKEFQVVECKML